MKIIKNRRKFEDDSDDINDNNDPGEVDTTN